MFDSLKFFFVALLLVSTAKLIQLNLYDFLVPYHLKDEAHGKDKDDHDESFKPIESKSDDSPKTLPVEDGDLETLSADSAIVDIDEPTSDTVVFENESKDLSSTVNNTSISGEAYFLDLKNAYLSPILASLPEGRSREDVVVRYYKHEKDGEKVYSLKKLGYYLHEREAEDSKDYGSNVLYYGSDVDVRDIQLVAYTLKQNGIPLKAIIRSQYDWKYHSLEIGADSLLVGRPILSLDEIQSFTL